MVNNVFSSHVFDVFVVHPGEIHVTPRDTKRHPARRACHDTEAWWSRWHEGLGVVHRESQEGWQEIGENHGNSELRYG